ncbi:MogA/MoaB family molybdenum cofactor biosynthesis protein [Tessaracoccus sp. MC1865]|uniref:MogA/MoaB family molybdenum cofactor biosynthesis protein n=1 Tax=Tessaracoccus sp. MC1865 TaxID=2760310 RepID=UPI001602FF70|nr:MogA/MoaB family molybdenum cofactor biosynthesis protein [Tessaracoccus sp. MC1865]MBB1483877.1 MogA/MoaB family molybdenum cofactor biosynthesis protein [Tessaracoccus sp. MC1865]QTO36932.1 MogA/MoaB family molybdenum cofactor biosynthesis protein [Tessaracoccus sp. MC1865]
MSHPAAVITCSDRAFADVYEDRSGPVAVLALREAGFDTPDPVIVPDDPEQIRLAVASAVDAGARVVVTSGGTGVSPTDITVEITRDLIAYEVPGLMEEVRRRGAERQPLALLSRGVAGVLALPDAKRALIINAPGSRGGVRDTMAVVGPLLGHIVDQLDGADHDMSAPPSQP